MLRVGKPCQSSSRNIAPSPPLAQLLGRDSAACHSSPQPPLPQVPSSHNQPSRMYAKILPASDSPLLAAILAC